jgi:hypothetical protein
MHPQVFHNLSADHTIKLPFNFTESKEWEIYLHKKLLSPVIKVIHFLGSQVYFNYSLALLSED